MAQSLKADAAMHKLSAKIGTLLYAEIRRREKTMPPAETFIRLYTCVAANLAALIDHHAKSVEAREELDEYVIKNFAEYRRRCAEETRTAQRVEHEVELAIELAKAEMATTH